MLRISFTLSLVLISAAVAGCAVADGATEGTNAAELTAQCSSPSAFVLGVQSRNAPVNISKPDGTLDTCPSFETCFFAYLEGTPLVVQQAWIFDRANCELFVSWLDACAGAGRNPTCTIVMNSDLGVDSDWRLVRGCIPP